jgi:RNA polymerase sigma-70 factor, ECF subfamily
MRAVAAGDASAVAELYDRHARAVFGMAMALLRDAGLAQDVTQEVFVRLWTRAHTFDAQRGTAAGWLVSVARNLSLDELRRQRRHSQRTDRLTREMSLDSHDATDLFREAGWESEEVLDALAELSSRQREVVELVYLRGYTLAEIAQRLDVAVGTVKSRLHSALLSLRATLGEHTRTPTASAGQMN